MIHAFRAVSAVWFAAVLTIASCGAQSPEPNGGQDLPDTGDTAAEHADIQPGGELEFIHAAHIFMPAIGASSDSIPPDWADREAYLSIRTIRERILSGESSFETMALEYSRCPSSSRGGALPAFTGGAVARPLDSAAAALAPGEISGIIRTRFGYHIVKRLDI